MCVAFILQWERTYALELNADGLFSVEIWLDPGRHLYHFIVDGVDVRYLETKPTTRAPDGAICNVVAVATESPLKYERSYVARFAQMISPSCRNACMMIEFFPEQRLGLMSSYFFSNRIETEIQDSKTSVHWAQVALAATLL